MDCSYWASDKTFMSLPLLDTSIQLGQAALQQLHNDAPAKEHTHTHTYTDTYTLSPTCVKNSKGTLWEKADTSLSLC